MAMTIEQQRAMAMANARARAVENEQPKDRGITGGLKDIAGGIVRGATGIASNIKRPFEAIVPGGEDGSSGHKQRMESVESRLANQGYDKDSLPFKLSKIGSEVAVTWPIGGVLAKGAGLIPGLTKALPSLAPALKTGGLSLGVAAPKTMIGRAATRTAAGSLTGGAMALPVDPDNVGTGMVIGGLLPNAIEGVVKPIARHTGEFIGPMTQSWQKSKIGEFLDDSMGSSKDKILNALRAYNATGAKDLTVADVVADMNIGKRGVEGSRLIAMEKKLQALPGEHSDKFKSMAQQQALERADKINRIATNQPQVPGMSMPRRQTYEQALEQANRERELATSPLRQQSLTDANLYNQKTGDLIEAISNAERRKVSALQAAGQLKTEAAQARQLSNAQYPWSTQVIRDRGTAGFPKQSSIRDIPTGRGAPAPTRNENVVSGFDKGAKEAADIAAIQQAKKNFAEYQLDSLSKHGYFPLRSQSVVSQIDNMLNTPGTGDRILVENTLKSIRDRVIEKTKPDGSIDSNTLYSIRKDIADMVKKNAIESATSDKHLASKLQMTAMKTIDDAIEGAGGTAWKKYLVTYAEKSKPVNRVKTGRLLSDALTESTGANESAGAFIRSVRNIRENELANATGKPRFADLTPDDLQAIDDVQRGLLRDKVKANIGSGINMNDVLRISEKEGALSMPQLWSRPASITNWVIKNIFKGKDVDNEMAKQIAMNMTDPRKFIAEYEAAKQAGKLAQFMNKNTMLSRIMNGAYKAGTSSYAPYVGAATFSTGQE